jgi:hypothetical protein
MRPAIQSPSGQLLARNWSSTIWMREMHWTKPQLAAQIRFVEWTAENPDQA